MSESLSADRARVIDALSFPRRLMMQEVEGLGCPRQHHFDEQTEACLDCLYILECQAQSERLTEPSLRAASDTQLYTLLQLGLEYVSQQPQCFLHDAEACDCAHCDWVREVRMLLRALQI